MNSTKKLGGNIPTHQPTKTTDNSRPAKPSGGRVLSEDSIKSHNTVKNTMPAPPNPNKGKKG